jgi:hypothetical protein
MPHAPRLPPPCILFACLHGLASLTFIPLHSTAQISRAPCHAPSTRCRRVPVRQVVAVGLGSASNAQVRAARLQRT